MQFVDWYTKDCKKSYKNITKCMCMQLQILVPVAIKIIHVNNQTDYIFFF